MRRLALLVALIATTARGDFVVKQGGAHVGTARDINCGTNMSCSISGVTATLSSSGGGGGSGSGGAPVDGGYVTFSGGTTGSTNERTLTAGTNIAISTTTPGQVSIGVTGTVAAASTASALAANPTDCVAGKYALAIDASGNLTCGQVGYGELSGTPTIPADISGEGYWVKTASGNLSNEVAMGSLGTGLVINTTTTGIPTIKGSNTCTNQFPRSDNASGTWTCASIATADLPTIDISKGGTTETASTEDAVLVGASTTDWVPKVLPSCSNATTSKLLYDSSTNTFSCGTDQTTGGLTVQTARTTGTHTIGSTTATEVTALQVTLAGAGTYDVLYNLRARSSSTTNGYKYGVNVTANLSSIVCVARHPTTGGAAATGVGDGVQATLTGGIYEVLGAANAASTTAPNMGPSTGVASATETIPVEIRCSVVTSGSGDLELWMGSEGAVNVTTEANSYVIVTTIP